MNKEVYRKLRLPQTSRVNKGACYFCGKDVFVSEGQAYKLYYGKPSHKKCR